MTNSTARSVRQLNRSGVMLAGLLGTTAVTAAMVNPALDDPSREWCYLAKSTTVIDVPWQPDVVQVTWDGALYTGSAELCFFSGNPPQPVMARQKTFLDGWIPIVQYDWQANGVSYAVEMFSAVIAGDDESNALQFVQVTATNQTAQPANAILTAACRGSGQDYRVGSPSFSSAWTFAIANNALIRNGQWVYGFEAGAQKVEAVQGVPYTQPFVGTTYGVTARMETGVVTYNVPLQAGEAKTFRFKMPRVPVAASNTALINSIAALTFADVPLTPPAPGGLVATPGVSQVALLWTAAAGATGYNIKRSSISNSSYTVIGTTAGATSYTDSTVTNGTTYYYLVSASNTAGESADSNQASATPNSAYNAWASDPAQGLTAGSDGPLNDPDHDGISNLLEFVLGGAPMVPSPNSILPKLTRTGGSWFYEYDRSDLSQPPATIQEVEYGNNLTGWTSITIPLLGAGPVTITPGNPSDHVKVTLPALGTNGFVRLKVTKSN